MTSLLLTFFVFFVLFGLAIFFWIWWVLPRGQVPPHLTEEELRRLEVQDRLRQTNYQILAALALGATFLGTVFQLTVASRQWASDYALKVAQERLGEFSEALKEIDLANVTATNRAGLRTLFALGIQDPANYHFQANDVMSAYVRQRTQTEVLTESAECRDDVFAQAVVTEGGRSYDNIPYPREEALPEVQAAMSALGHPKFAAHRERYVNGACESWTSHGADMTQLRLDHLILDDLDLAGVDLSCALMSQTRLRRVDLQGSSLRGVDFRGARAADFDIPGSPSKNGRVKSYLYKSEEEGGPPSWKRSRCWVTDFRNADLTDSDFEGAILAGADFEDANLENVNLCRADVSRVNLEGAKGLKKEMLMNACVGRSENAPDGAAQGVDRDAQPFFGDERPFGQDFAIPRCRTDKKCEAKVRP